MKEKVDKRKKNKFSDKTKENGDGPTKKINDVFNESPESYTPENTLNQPKKAQKSNRSTKSCNFCNETFSAIEKLEKHIIRAHAEHRPYQCTTCKKTFKLQRQLKFHEKVVHVEVYNYKCDICPKTYKHKISLKQHKKQHSNPDEFRCTLCLKVLSDKPALEKHTLTHLKGQSYPCNICTKTFKLSSSLRDHRRKEHDVRIIVEEKPERKFTCATCEKKFFHKNTLKKHVLLVHLKVKAYKCSVCLSSYAKRESLIKHKLREKHGQVDPKTVFECDQCHAVFPVKCSLKAHSKIHAKVRDETQCEICKESVESGRKLMDHMKLKHPEFCYTCAVCNKSYINKGHLVRHIKATH